MKEKGKDLLLRILAERGSLPQSELVRLSGLSKSRVSEILSELEREGLIDKRVLAGKNLEISLKRSIRIGIIRAAEYPFVIPFYKKLKENGFIPKLVVYENGVELTKDLALGKIEIGFSPVVTQLIFSKAFPIKIVAGGAKGGAGVVGEGCKVGSTVLSSMEVWTLSEIKNAQIVPFNSPEEMIRALREGKVGSIAIWEPFFSTLRANGFKVSHVFEPIHCCTMGVREGVDDEKIKRIYEESFTWFLESKDRWIPDYANLLGEDYNVMAKAVQSYTFDSYLDLREVERNLKKSGIYIPS
ncbi:MAG: marR family transcriptional regulator [Candidatus Aramenus sulfurataquae]|uniref:MarR family transcriptional regulator n=1 Tax=Candidatus Aramenus sulfurataquae TaxID=1326980 RepID=W7L7V8_9CREN|nr:MAG: marR family transcriptional regulator [Candidatus Aramenus sulfurataquae]